MTQTENLKPSNSTGLEQPEQEPVAEFRGTLNHAGRTLYLIEPKANLTRGMQFYTTPTQRKPLTDDEIKSIEQGIWNPEFFDEVEIQANREFARAIEAAHGIKDTK